MTLALLNPTSADVELERRIAGELANMLGAQARGDSEAARLHLERMNELIGQRSPEQVERLERAKGLR